MDKKSKVIVVEDDELLLKVYKHKLESEGIDTIISTDGEDAVSKVFSEKPDLIVLDLMLPKKDGFWVILKIRENQEFANTPIIVISNRFEPVDKERAFALGANGFLVKVNITIEEVVEKVKEYLKK